MADLSMLMRSVARLAVLGVDSSGQIIQCSQGVAQALGCSSELVLGRYLNEVISADPCASGSHDAAADPFVAAKTGQEWTGTVALHVGWGAVRQVELTLMPLHDHGGRLTSLALIGEDVEEGARDAGESVRGGAFGTRRLLDEAHRRVGTTLDLDQTAKELIDAIVPSFCNAAGILMLEGLVGDGEPPAEPTDGSAVLRRLAVGADDDNRAWFATFPVGEVLTFPTGTPYTECLNTGKPVHITQVADTTADSIARAWRRDTVADLLARGSMLLVPLPARGANLGFIVCVRKPDHGAFDEEDVQALTEFADRAGIFLDNARLYSRERATALTLQRSMLPSRLTPQVAVDLAHRYLPGSDLAEVGGDWYDAIALPGARVAIVVGDVSGHSVRSAVTMGQLRTAVRAFASLELSPMEMLERLDDLMAAGLSGYETNFATCLFAVYDPVAGTCEIANAGHLPPLLRHPDGTDELIDVPPGRPLGVSNQAFGNTEITVPPDALFMLYTDGLVENRSKDLDVGTAALRERFTEPWNSLEELCDAVLSGVFADYTRDDIAFIIARLGRLAPDRHASWELTGDSSAVRDARRLIHTTLARWELRALAETAELVVSELVTNAVRYAIGPVRLRLLRGSHLVCEVYDGSAALPRLGVTAVDAESGRGLQVVNYLAQRWGSRRTKSGKVVWCELALPDDSEQPNHHPTTEEAGYSVL